MLVPIPVRVRQWRCPHCDHVLNRRIYFWPLRETTLACPRCKQTIHCSRDVVVASWRMAIIIRSLFVFWMLLILYALAGTFFFRSVPKDLIFAVLVLGWLPCMIPAIIVGWIYGTHVGRSHAKRLNLS